MMKYMYLFVLIVLMASVVIAQSNKDQIFDPIDFMFPDMQLNAPIPEPIPQGDFVQVKDGEKIICALCGKVLKDVEVKYLPAEDVGQGIYFDDGTHGDEKANDNVFSQIKITNDVICEDDNNLKERFEFLCKKSLETDAVEFYGIPYVTDMSPQSTTMDFLTNKRNSFVVQFRHKHLQKYVNPNTDVYYLVYKDE